MPKRVLDVGNCVPDHSAIRRLVEKNFDAQVLQAHHADDALQTLRAGEVHLVLVNRKLDIDYTDGLEIIKLIKADPQLQQVPVMMVTNLPDHQEIAVQAGAEPGFGKNHLGHQETVDKLRKYLD